MNFSSNLILNIYSVAILTIIFIHALSSTEKILLQQKFFILMLLITVLMLITDTISRFDGNPGTPYAALNQIGNFLIFTLSPILPSFWLLYAHYQVNDEEGKIRPWLHLLPIINALNAIMVILSQFFGWYYAIDADNIYHRGPLYWLPVFITAFLAVSAFVLIIANRKKIDRKNFISLALFPIPPLVCCVLQVSFYGTSLMLNGVALSLLIVFITIQNQRMNTDYLTGAYNRKGLEIFIRQKMNTISDNKTFSAILLDLDNFKSINDAFGHSTGDHVLVTSVKLLKDCLKPDDFIARLGGDEFYIILNISSMDELKAAAHKIKQCFENYSEKSIEPFKLGVSMGYAVYHHQLHMNAAEFQKQVDLLMYEDKRAKKRIQHA